MTVVRAYKLFYRQRPPTGLVLPVGYVDRQGLACVATHSITAPNSHQALLPTALVPFLEFASTPSRNLRSSGS